MRIVRHIVLKCRGELEGMHRYHTVVTWGQSSIRYWQMRTLDCHLPALIISNVAGRTLSVGTLCTGDNLWTKSNSSGLRGSPYSLVHALPDDVFNQISIGHSITNDNSPPVNLWNWETEIRDRIRNVVRLNYLEEVCDTTFGNRSPKRSLRCPDYRTTDKKTYISSSWGHHLNESKKMGSTHRR